MSAAMDRRSFVKLTGGGLAGVLAARRAPAYAQGARLHLVRWVDFVPAGDEVLKGQMAEAGKALGAEITLETINANDLQPRITAAISSGSGADIFHLLHNWAHLYEKSLADVGDLVAALGKAQGGYYPVLETLDRVNGVWRAVPHSIVGGQIAYRKSIFESVGAKEFPKTWQEYREVGKRLKAKGYPIGQTAGHTFGDAPTFWYPAMWAWGGKEVEKDGKTVAINSKETVESVKFFTGFWKDACDEGGLAWDDSNNNRAFLSGTIAATINGASIYIESLRNKEKYKTETGALMHTDIAHAPSPAGPAGTLHYHTSFHHAVMGYSKNQKLAKDFLRWLHSKERFEPWFVAEKGFSVGATTDWEKHKMWEQDPVMLPFRTAARAFRVFGYAGPPSARASEVYSKYVIVDMYAKAIQGMPAEEAVKWADGELRKTYA
ncbi:MAG TPA: extracellular solute-binding protein [Acidimicrobiia bacterium]|jgi:multiple sugar transport system substrate-binding protein|nr:extracellular solute-binding protein [Acidimicrobiia bacterium]